VDTLSTMQRALVDFRLVVAFVLTAILLQAVLITPDCVAIPSQYGSALQRADDVPSDACCNGSCALCFCCHFTALMGSADLNLSPAPPSLFEAAANPPLFERTIRPFSRPPRT
jgi:hypothetical protein